MEQTVSGVSRCLMSLRQADDTLGTVIGQETEAVSLCAILPRIYGFLHVAGRVGEIQVQSERARESSSRRLKVFDIRPCHRTSRFERSCTPHDRTRGNSQSASHVLCEKYIGPGDPEFHTEILYSAVRLFPSRCLRRSNTRIYLSCLSISPY